MSHNPNTVKSQDDLPTTNDGKRSSDVVLSAVEKCERLQKQFDIAEMALKEIEKSGTNPEIKTITTLCVNNFLLAHKALKEIEELNK